MRASGLLYLVQAAAVTSVALLVVLAWAPSGALPLNELSSSTAEDGQRVIEVPVQAVDCPDGYDNGATDDVCLAYDGQIPGPTWVLGKGQDAQVRLSHDVESTIADLDVDAELAEELAEARYSLHRHGVSVANCEDGVARPLGTDVCGSTVGPPGAIEPAGSVTYNFTADFAGPWHYHDHAKGVDVGAAVQPVLGSEAVERGLFGSFVVLEDPEASDHVFDLHLLDAGANGGLGLDETVGEGERFDVLVVGLGDHAWDVRLEHDEEGTVAEVAVGPGVSRSMRVEDARPGTYTWTATSPMVGVYDGEVTVE